MKASTPDTLVVEGVNDRGFGTIPKRVMQDEGLTIEAKAIYAYFCSYAGAGETSFPSRKKLCADLVITPKRYYRHRELLVERGYLKIEPRYAADGSRRSNIFRLPSFVHAASPPAPVVETTAWPPPAENEDSASSGPCGRNDQGGCGRDACGPCGQEGHGEKEQPDTNNQNSYGPFREMSPGRDDGEDDQPAPAPRSGFAVVRSDSLEKGLSIAFGGSS